jgi:hypothetical protein
MQRGWIWTLVSLQFVLACSSVQQPATILFKCQAGFMSGSTLAVWQQPLNRAAVHATVLFACLLCSDRLVRACAELPKLCEFFHIPFQSGDDDILREMARGYTAARYRSIIDNIRRYMPDASISGDAIVGFPGVR